MKSPEHLGILTDVPTAPKPKRWTFRDLPTFKLHLLGGLSERYSESIYKRLVGLKLLESRVIGVIHSFGRLPFKQLCQEANLDKSYASRLVNRLSDAGLIEKEGSLVDQRSVMLKLTPQGVRMHRQLHAEAVALNERLMAALTPEQAETFVTCLDLLVGQLRSFASSQEEDASSILAQVVGEASDDDLPATEAAGERLSIDADAARRLHALLEAALGRK